MSGYIGTQPVPQATQTRDVFTATSGQTSFATSGYTPNFLDVWLNGVKLVNGDDFTATNGSDVVLTTGAAAGDTVEVLSYSTFEVNSQTFTGTTTLTGDLQATTATFSGAVTGTSATLSGGVYLGGTGAANLLDDYEQGTFNVELWANGTQLALSEYGGSYVKVGNLVTVNFEADCSNTNGASGALQVRGMPFTIADVLSPTGIEANGSVSYWQSWSTPINSPTLYAEGGTTMLIVMGSTSSTAASNTNLTAANIGTGEFRGTITYRTT